MSRLKNGMWRSMWFDAIHQNKDRVKGVTYDCAFLEPLALPPDFPPVILNVGCKRVGFEKRGEFRLLS